MAGKTREPELKQFKIKGLNLSLLIFLSTSIKINSGYPSVLCACLFSLQANTESHEGPFFHEALMQCWGLLLWS